MTSQVIKTCLGIRFLNQTTLCQRVVWGSGKKNHKKNQRLTSGFVEDFEPKVNKFDDNKKSLGQSLIYSIYFKFVNQNMKVGK